MKTIVYISIIVLYAIVSILVVIAESSFRFKIFLDQYISQFTYDIIAKYHNLIIIGFVIYSVLTFLIGNLLFINEMKKITDESIKLNQLYMDEITEYLNKYKSINT